MFFRPRPSIPGAVGHPPFVPALPPPFHGRYNIGTQLSTWRGKKYIVPYLDRCYESPTKLWLVRVRPAYRARPYPPPDPSLPRPCYSPAGPPTRHLRFRSLALWHARHRLGDVPR